MKDYTIQEMPNIDDADRIKCCVSVQSMRCTLSALLRHAISQLTVTPFTVQIRVALSIMKRLAEGALSIELLCQKHRVRDAAILLLNVHELRIDRQYIARDPRRANIWLDHTEEHRKPWRVAEQMAEIYTTPNELDAERSIYRQYSMVKHSNPVGQTFALRSQGIGIRCILTAPATTAAWFGRTCLHWVPIFAARYQPRQKYWPMRVLMQVTTPTESRSNGSYYRNATRTTYIYDA